MGIRRIFVPNFTLKSFNHTKKKESQLLDATNCFYVHFDASIWSCPIPVCWRTCPAAASSLSKANAVWTMTVVVANQMTHWLEILACFCHAHVLDLKPRKFSKNPTWNASLSLVVITVLYTSSGNTNISLVSVINLNQQRGWLLSRQVWHPPCPNGNFYIVTSCCIQPAFDWLLCHAACLSDKTNPQRAWQVFRLLVCRRSSQWRLSGARLT